MADDFNANGMLINFLISNLYKKIKVPPTFHGQAKCVKEMLGNDIGGLVGALTDFQVSAANVNWSIRTGNDTLDDIMSRWLDTVNSGFNGKVPSGIQALATEYYKERWKGASFPILKILEWGEIDGFNVPTKMAFVEGSEIYTDTNKNAGDFVDLGDQKYYLGDKLDDANLLDVGCIITKPFGRWFDEYPPIYLIKNGVFYNWKLEQSLINKMSEILDQIIPYMLLIKKGTEGLALRKNVNYDNKQLKEVAQQLEELIQKTKDFQLSGKKANKTAIRASQFDEEIEHFIPNLETILKQELTTGMEKRQLAGLGFIDIANAVSSSRRESVLNPKAFIQETMNGIGDAQKGSGFAAVLKEVLVLVKEKNQARTKFSNASMRIIHSKPQIFMDKDFRDFLLSLYNRGLLSKKTLVEVGGDEIYSEEIDQREREARNGDEYTMYAPVTQNMETQGANDYLGSSNRDPNKDMTTTQDKIGPGAKQKYDMNVASIFEKDLVGSPYSSIAKLPDGVKKSLPRLKDQREWMAVWNASYHFYLGKFGDSKKAETMAFKTAWSKFKH